MRGGPAGYVAGGRLVWPLVLTRPSRAAVRVSLAAVLYDPAQFERLTDEPWDPARVEDAIATIFADADVAFDLDALWPAHEWDGWEEPLR